MNKELKKDLAILSGTLSEFVKKFAPKAIETIKALEKMFEKYNKK